MYFVGYLIKLWIYIYIYIFIKVVVVVLFVKSFESFLDSL